MLIVERLEMNNLIIAGRFVCFHTSSLIHRPVCVLSHIILISCLWHMDHSHPITTTVLNVTISILRHIPLLLLMSITNYRNTSSLIHRSLHAFLNHPTFVFAADKILLSQYSRGFLSFKIDGRETFDCLAIENLTKFST